MALLRNRFNLGNRYPCARNARQTPFAPCRPPLEAQFGLGIALTPAPRRLCMSRSNEKGKCDQVAAGGGGGAAGGGAAAPWVAPAAVTGSGDDSAALQQRAVSVPSSSAAALPGPVVGRTFVEAASLAVPAGAGAGSAPLATEFTATPVAAPTGVVEPSLDCGSRRMTDIVAAGIARHDKAAARLARLLRPLQRRDVHPLKQRHVQPLQQCDDVRPTGRAGFAGRGAQFLPLTPGSPADLARAALTSACLDRVIDIGMCTHLTLDESGKATSSVYRVMDELQRSPLDVRAALACVGAAQRDAESSDAGTADDRKNVVDKCRAFCQHVGALIHVPATSSSAAPPPASTARAAAAPQPAIPAPAAAAAAAAAAVPALPVAATAAAVPASPVAAVLDVSIPTPAAGADGGPESAVGHP
jgi:hypothetical protein